MKTWQIAVTRPSKEEREILPRKAQALIEAVQQQQREVLNSGDYQFSWIAEKHFLLAGATGAGLGGCLATAILDHLSARGSLTIISRDLTHSLPYETGNFFVYLARSKGFADRVHWINDGLATEGKAFDQVVEKLKQVGARKIIYVNTVAAAYSGLLPGFPQIYIKDVGDDGLFQWTLPYLTEKNIEASKYIMGTLAVSFPYALEKHGFFVDLVVFADTRGSLDRLSRDPSSSVYGRQGAYSSSLHLPKDIIQQEVSWSYQSGKRRVMDFFMPMMRTRALTFIPGARLTSLLFDRLMELTGIRRIDIPELALMMLRRMGESLEAADYNPFPRLDGHEAQLDLWLNELLQHLNNDEDSDYYYKKWIKEN